MAMNRDESKRWDCSVLSYRTSEYSVRAKFAQRLPRARVNAAISPPGHRALHPIPKVPGSSKHGVVVRCARRHRLQDVPVLDHLALLQAKDVRRGGAAVFG